jgi:DNA-binding NarL/FixJ family response regulator
VLVPSSTMPHTVLIVEANRLCGEMNRRTAQLALPHANIIVLHRIIDADLTLSRDKVDLLLISTEVHDADVIDYLFKWLAEPKYSLPTLVITARHDERLVNALNSLPLVGVFDPHSEGADELARAIELIASGGRYWSATSMKHMQTRFSNQDGIFRRLTPIQLIIFALVGAGRSDASIASDLVLAEATIESTRRDLRSIFAVNRQCELIFLAARFGIVRIAADKIEVLGYTNLLSRRTLHAVQRTRIERNAA